MSRHTLYEAASEVERAGEAVTETDTATGDRLASLADRLRRQAERETTPALGTLDRVQHALGEVADEADDEEVRRRLETARERIFDFLATLEDRGMGQHGGR